MPLATAFKAEVQPMKPWEFLRKSRGSTSLQPSKKGILFAKQGMANKKFLHEIYFSLMCLVQMCHHARSHADRSYAKRKLISTHSFFQRNYDVFQPSDRLKQILRFSHLTYRLGKCRKATSLPTKLETPQECVCLLAAELPSGIVR